MRIGHQLVIAVLAAALAACAAPSGQPSGVAAGADTAAADSIEVRVTALLVDNFGIPREAVTPRARLSEDLGMDDLDVIEFVMEVEEEFGTEIPDEVLERMRTVGDVIAFLRSRS